MSNADHKQLPALDTEQRRQGDLAAPVSDYEYFQLSPVARQLQTPVAPPQYQGSHSPVSPPLSSQHSDLSGGEVSPNRTSQFPNYPRIVPEHEELKNTERSQAPAYQLAPDHDEKEAYAQHRPVPSSNPTSVPNHTRNQLESSTPDVERDEKHYPFGLTRKRFRIAVLTVVFLIIAVAVAIGVGVGVGTSHPNSSSGNTGADPRYTIGGALNPAYYSTIGAFNGSGVALADVNFGLDNSLYVFYQKYNGDIEQLIYQNNGQWQFVTTVATDGKNATPLSTVAYIVDSVATWHLFYIGEDNQLKQRIQSNASSFQTNIWQDGPINSLNLSVYNANSVGMQACYWGNYYGSLQDYDGQQFKVSNSTPTTGINVWYAKDATTFEQYDWTFGQSTWQYTRTWNNTNAHAGVGCQSWLSNTTSYVFMVDTTNSLQVWWRDIDTNKTSTPTHPINEYTLVQGVNISGIWPSSSLGYTDFAIYQTMDWTVHGVNISWAAENTSIAPALQSTSSATTSSGNGLDEWALAPADRGLPGTRMAITGSQPASGGEQELLFYQEIGNDLRLAIRDRSGGAFSFINVPVGDALGKNKGVGRAIARDEKSLGTEEHTRRRRCGRFCARNSDA